MACSPTNGRKKGKSSQVCKPFTVISRRLQGIVLIMHLTMTTTVHYTVGASADSGYEYFLKQWLLMGDVKARDQCT
jgi:hypothetical protein